jgi:hypothetical protein
MVRGKGYEIGTIDSYVWDTRSPATSTSRSRRSSPTASTSRKRFLGATRKGWEFTNGPKGPSVCEKVTKILAPNYGTKLDQQLAQRTDQIPFMQSDLTKKKGLLYVNLQDWENAIRILYDIGEIETVPKVESFVTTAVLDGI